MANDLNQCNFIGRLGKDPEMRYMQDGSAVASFSIAVGWKGKDKEGTEWVNVSAFGKLAEIVGEYCTKGKQVFVSGRFHTRKWQDKEGNDRYSTQINADRIQLLGSKPEGESERPATTGAARTSNDTKAPAKSRTPGGFDEMDDDVPF